MSDASGERTLRGILLMVAAGASFAVLDATVKVLAARYPAPMIAWTRYFFHVAIMLVVLWPSLGRRMLATRRPGLQVVRGFCLGASSLFFFGALAYMPLAEATAIIAIAPILVTVGAVRWFGERAPAGAWVSLALSFAGVLLIVRPGGALFTWASAMPLLTAVFASGYQLATRRLAGVDHGVSTLFLGGVVATVLLGLVVPFYWTMPASPGDAALFVLIGAIGAGGHMLLVRAYDHASASTLAPFGYSHVVAALPIGFIVFGAFPDRLGLVGMAMIVLTGMWIAWRSRTPAPRPPME